MVRLPREEMSYRKLYRHLDLERDLGIEWPEVPDALEVVFVDEEQEVQCDACQTLDEYDEEFCAAEKIDRDAFAAAFRTLDANFNASILDRIGSLKTISKKHPCDVCGGAESSGDRVLLICQGCGICVHDECYGIPESPAGQWLCKKCVFHFEDGSCRFCDKKEGILKRTDTNEWGHVVCALLNPSLSFCNTGIRDPIDTSEYAPVDGVCSICSHTSHSLIRCSFGECGVVYHASCCAETLYCDLNNGLTYCNIHNPLRKHKAIMSRRNILRLLDAYPDMDQDAFLRKPMRLTSPSQTEYMDAVCTAPYAIRDGLDEQCDSGKIEKYWIRKRRAFGSYFSDMFIFSNHLRAE